jgi:alkylresorcinol/alkylpyrone synthase
VKIISTATAFPEHYYPQNDITVALGDFWNSQLNNRAVLERFHNHAGVSGRHLVLPLTEFPKLKDWGEANDLFIHEAVDLGQRAVQEALDRQQISADQIGAMFFVSITGISNPSIDARLMNRIAFSPYVKRIPIFGLGCVGGAAGIARAADYLKAYPEQMALVLSVELCSLTWQRADLSPAHVVSSALFGDGAAAVILSGADHSERKGPRVVANESIFYHDTVDVMGWHIAADGFRVVLSPDVPKVISQNLRHDVDSFLGKHNLSRHDIGLWIMHTGGPKVLDAIEAALELSPDALSNSRECLDEIGNISSASVLAVLDKIMRNNPPPSGTWSILSAMGPGFCAELVLLQW